MRLSKTDLKVKGCESLADVVGQGGSSPEFGSGFF